MVLTNAKPPLRSRDHGTAVFRYLGDCAAYCVTERQAETKLALGYYSSLTLTRHYSINIILTLCRNVKTVWDNQKVWQKTKTVRRSKLLGFFFLCVHVQISIHRFGSSLADAVDIYEKYNTHVNPHRNVITILAIGCKHFIIYIKQYQF